MRRCLFDRIRVGCIRNADVDDLRAGETVENGRDRRVGLRVGDRTLAAALLLLGERRPASLARQRDDPATAGPFLQPIGEITHHRLGRILSQADVEATRLNRDKADTPLEKNLEGHVALRIGESGDVLKRFERNRIGHRLFGNHRRLDRHGRCFG